MAILTKSDWSGQILLKSAGAALDLTGFTFDFVIKARRSASSALVTLTVGNGLTVDAAAGKVTIVLTAAQTSAIGSGDRYFALYRTDGGRRLALVSGKMIVREGV